MKKGYARLDLTIFVGEKKQASEGYDLAFLLSSGEAIKPHSHKKGHDPTRIKTLDSITDAIDILAKEVLHDNIIIENIILASKGEASILGAYNDIDNDLLKDYEKRCNEKLKEFYRSI